MPCYARMPCRYQWYGLSLPIRIFRKTIKRSGSFISEWSIKSCKQIQNTAKGQRLKAEGQYRIQLKAESLKLKANTASRYDVLCNGNSKPETRNYNTRALK